MSRDTKTNKQKRENMTKLEATIEAKRLSREASEEMARQNQKCSLTRSYAKADRLAQQAREIRRKYGV
jgi:hypothetical protein